MLILSGDLFDALCDKALFKVKDAVCVYRICQRQGEYCAKLKRPYAVTHTEPLFEASPGQIRAQMLKGRP